ncbi:MAG: 23S rRNA (guanine(2445)-N(2))/(guanine(2069)-N(7))-methyltransferase, partial [Spirochaetaceae bacterium]
MKNTQTFIATCPLYCEDLLQTELERFGAKNITARHGAVHFTGTIMSAYCVCLWSRIANTVLYPLATVKASSKEELFEALVKIPYSDHFNVDKTFAVRSHLSETFLDNTNYATLFVKDAIADSFRSAMNRRPNVDAERPDIRFSFFLQKDEATLSIELSSESLHRRSYRRAGVAAPLKENVASAVLLRSEWERFA